MFCEDGKHIFHKWSDWYITTGIETKGILWGKRAGEESEVQVRARNCEHCKKLEWKYLYA